MKTLRHILPALILLSTSSIALGGSFQDGVDAANKGTYKAAYKVFLELAKQGDARAQYNLGFMYYEGLGVSKDSKEAFKWFRHAAEQRQGRAQHSLGVMYLQGSGVQKDPKEAFKWFRLAAYQGYADAQFYLGVMYLEGAVTPKDHVLAHMWFALSAARGVESAAHHREKCEENMSPSQIKKARAMATNWKSRK
jgi:hypothetical protein